MRRGVRSGRLMQRVALVIVAAAMVPLATARYSAADDAADAKDTNSLKGAPAPDFSLTTIDGKPVKLSDQKGSVVVLDFWATWCPPCRASLPHVQKIATDDAKARQGMKVFAVNAGEKAGTVNNFLQKNGYTFNVPMDATGATLKDYLVRGIPTTVIVGRDGTVADVFIGFGGTSAAEIDAAIDKALATK